MAAYTGTLGQQVDVTVGSVVVDPQNKSYTMGGTKYVLDQIGTHRVGADTYDVLGVIPGASTTDARLVGAGPPNGVVAAPPGTYYTDNLMTTGAIEWVKRTGTGNTGWEVTVGDTKARNIASTLDTAVWETTSYVRLRRLGDHVYLYARLTVKAGSPLIGVNRSQTVIGVVPFAAGFAPEAANSAYPSSAFFSNERGAIGGVNNISSGGRLDAQVPAAGVVAAGDVLALAANWTTAAAWPSVLPGLPA